MAGIVVIGVFLKSQNKNSTSNESGSDESPPAADLQNTVKPPSQFEATEEGSPGATVAGSVSSTKGMKREAPQVTQALFNDHLKKTMTRYQILQSKSVMTDAEQNEMASLLKDGEFVRQIGEVLRSRKAIQDPQFNLLQSAAVDFIVQALKQGDEDAASEAAWDIIRDTQVEDPSIPLAERKTLAGIKGEILYNATAVRPDIFQEVEMDLPGPASQKIWQNVQGQQQDNLKESQEEVLQYEQEQQKKDDE